jgi:RNA polymerase sigma factor (TIGR02999 family)
MASWKESGPAMNDSRRGEVTRILMDLGRDDVDQIAASNRLFEAVYAELRRLAGGMMRGERRDHTLQPTALVHETYLRLVGGSEIEWRNRAHFFGIAASAMRRILVEHARQRAAAKRGGAWKRVTLDSEIAQPGVSDVEVLDLDRALTNLAELDGRAARVVELRVFAGMEMKEIAHILGVSERTVHGDWRVAKMWLARELSEGASP